MKQNMHNMGGDLRLVSSCPLCGKRYDQNCASVIEEHKNMFLLHIQCNKCKGSVVSSMMSGQIGVSSIGLITDLTSDDVVKFRHRSLISGDDVLELHHFLKKNNDITNVLSSAR